MAKTRGLTSIGHRSGTFVWDPDAYSISWAFAIWNGIKGNDARAAKTTYFCCRFPPWVVVWQGPWKSSACTVWFLTCMNIFGIQKVQMLCLVSVALLISRVRRNPGELKLVQSFEIIASTLVLFLFVYFNVQNRVADPDSGQRCYHWWSW